MQYGRQINTTQGSGPSRLEEITNARKWRSAWVPQPERESEIHDNAHPYGRDLDESHFRQFIGISTDKIHLVKVVGSDS